MHFPTDKRTYHPKSKETNSEWVKSGFNFILANLCRIYIRRFLHEELIYGKNEEDSTFK
jgi:hypothetical protein